VECADVVRIYRGNEVLPMVFWTLIGGMFGIPPQAATECKFLRTLPFPLREA
jgi:hypothetical protein